MKPRGRYKPRKAPTKPATVGDRLRILRLQHGLTQAQVADRLFTDQTTVSSWERGKAAPSGAALAAVCMLFGVDRRSIELGERLDEAFPQSGVPLVAAESVPLGFDQDSLGKHAGGLVDLMDGQVSPVGPAALRKALEQAIQGKRPVWVVTG